MSNPTRNDITGDRIRSFGGGVSSEKEKPYVVEMDADQAISALVEHHHGGIKHAEHYLKVAEKIVKSLSAKELKSYILGEKK